MDQLRAMRTFVHVADANSFVSASRAMNISPAVVTRTIAELEDSLGVRLLDRSTRHVTLTNIGGQYLDRARSILEDVEEARAQASSSVALPKGHVRIRAPASFAVRRLAELLPRFHAAHPDITVEVNASGAVSTIDESHDLTIAISPDALRGTFVARRLASSEVLLCAGPGYLASAGRPAHPHDLVNHRLLASDGRTRHALTMTPRRLQPPMGLAIQLPAALTTENSEFAAAAALAGLGIAALPSYAVQEHLLTGQLEHVLPGWRLFDVTIWLCMRTRKHIPAATRALADFVVSEYGGVDSDRWAVAA